LFRSALLWGVFLQGELDKRNDGSGDSSAEPLPTDGVSCYGNSVHTCVLKCPTCKGFRF